MKSKPIFVLLAGGKSERMGVAKGLLKFKKTFWILEQIQRISKADILEVYIGLGYNYQHYFDAIYWFESATKKPYNFLGLNINISINKTPELGSFSTLQVVLEQIPTNTDILINPIDVPLLKTEELQKILDKKSMIVIPNFNKKNGHPIKFKYKFWEQLMNLNPSHNKARLDIQIKNQNSKDISYITVNDASILENLNTSSDWKVFLKKNIIR